MPTRYVKKLLLVNKSFTISFFLCLLYCSQALASDVIKEQLNVLTAEIRQLRTEIKELARDYFSFGELIERVSLQKETVKKKAHTLEDIQNYIKIAEAELQTSIGLLASLSKDSMESPPDFKDEYQSRISAEESAILIKQKHLQELRTNALQAEADLSSEKKSLEDLIARIGSISSVMSNK